jgi:hypothetical protein
MLINSGGVALGLLLAQSVLQNGLATIESMFLQRG